MEGDGESKYKKETSHVNVRCPRDRKILFRFWQKGTLSQLEITSPLQGEFSFWTEKWAGMPAVVMGSEAELPTLWADETAWSLQ